MLSAAQQINSLLVYILHVCALLSIQPGQPAAGDSL